MQKLVVKAATAVAVFAILTAVAEARMYQWTNPATGNVQLAGSPPAWYRATQDGPRVLVFDDGELVDDTAVSVSEAQRLALRGVAFGEGSDVAAPAAADVAANQLKEAMDKAHDEGIDIEAVAEEFNQTRAAETAAPGDEALSDKVAALKSLIDLWDAQQLQQAHSILNAIPERQSTP